MRWKAKVRSSGADYMDALLNVNQETKKQLVDIWKTMDNEGKKHFVDQVAVALSIWGADDNGKRIVVEIFKLMAESGTSTLADFGIYVNYLLESELIEDRRKKVEKAAKIIGNYRLRNNLPQEPQTDML